MKSKPSKSAREQTNGARALSSGIQALRLGNFPQAKEYLRASLDCPPSGRASHLQRQISACYLVQAYIESGELDAAESLVETSLAASNADLAQLLSAFIQLRRAKSLQPYIKELRGAAHRLARIRSKGVDVIHMKALAGEFEARGLAIASRWDLTKARFGIAAQKCFQRVEKLWQKAHDHRQCQLAKLHRAMTVCKQQRSGAAKNGAAQSEDAVEAFLQEYRKKIRRGCGTDEVLAEMLLSKLENALGNSGRGEWKDTFSSQEITLSEIESVFSGQQNVIGLARLQLLRGRLMLNAGQDGKSLIEESVEKFHNLGARFHEFEALSALADVYLQAGNVQKSLEWRARAMDVAREIGFVAGEGVCALAWGDVFLRKADYPQAVHHYHLALQKLALPRMRVALELQLANALCLLDQTLPAEEICQALLKRLKRADPQLRSQALFLLGTIGAARAEWPKALECWTRSLAIEVRRGSIFTVIERKNCIAQALVMQAYQGNGGRVAADVFSRAIGLCQQNVSALSQFAGLQASSLLAGTLQVMGQVTLASGAALDSLRMFTSAEEHYRRMGLEVEAANSATLQGLVCRFLESHGHPGMEKEAGWHFSRAMEFFEARGMQAMAKKVQSLRQAGAATQRQPQAFAH